MFAIFSASIYCASPDELDAGDGAGVERCGEQRI
jgi:hypothetical protein